MVTTPPPLLSVTGLRKQYADRVVLDGVSLEVSPGETVVVIGPSGSGKTTMLRCLNYLESPDDGAVKLGEERIGYDPHGKRLPEIGIARQRERFGFVFQRFNLFSHLNARGRTRPSPRRLFWKPRNGKPVLWRHMCCPLS